MLLLVFVCLWKSAVCESVFSSLMSTFIKLKDFFFFSSLKHNLTKVIHYRTSIRSVASIENATVFCCCWTPGLLLCPSCNFQLIVL